MTNIPTIVAPGGSYKKAIVAAKYGAEEVYIGVPYTSLRMRQNTLRDFEILKDTVKQIHGYGAKALLTMNIFPRNQDIKIFEMVVERLVDSGADAIIFSDLGTYKTIRKYFPDIPLHLSTQTTTLNYAAVQFWHDLGIKRIVCARELNIKEIREIKENVPDMELEVFVHGAMCITYSGRCLMGDYMSGRAGNKGECSHACRFKYKVRLEEERRPGKLYQLRSDETGSYMMSSKDLCVIDSLEEIIPYVDAIKIEGRSKSEFYVGALVKAYKHVRDSIINNQPIDEQVRSLVNVIPHREYWDGFLLNELKQYPEGEPEDPKKEEKKIYGDKNISEVEEDKQYISTVTKTTAGPMFSRNYYGVFSDKFIEKDGKKYFEFAPKEVLEIGMEVKYLSPDSMGVLSIIDILDENGKDLIKATCNTRSVYILTDKNIQGREVLYKDPNINDISNKEAVECPMD